MAAGRPVLLEHLTNLHEPAPPAKTQSLHFQSMHITAYSSAMRAIGAADALKARYLHFPGSPLRKQQRRAYIRPQLTVSAKKSKINYSDARSSGMPPYELGNGPRHAVPETREEEALPDWAAIRGWRMVVAATKTDIGYVETALERLDDSLACPILRVYNENAPKLFGESEVHLIPFARPLVNRLDYKAKCCFIAPPDGLLELGRCRSLLAYLRPILKGEAEGAERHCMYMPSICSLVASGHNDLVPLIKAAGGFFQVAQSLGLRARRKPPGFWDNEDSLDEEIGQFVADSWTEHLNGATSDTYFYNQVTSEVRWEKPLGVTVVELDDSGTQLRAEPPRNRVMPSQSQLATAGRWDLHHAILYNGGYSEVAKLLKRRPPRRGRPLERPRLTMKAIAAELRAFQCSVGNPPGLLPSARVLVEAGRSDLLQAVRALGGYHTAAEVLGLNASRKPRGYWSRFETVVAELRLYRSSHSRLQHSDRLPTHRELLEDGRADLRYGMQLHSHHGLADALQLQGSAQGGHNHKKLATGLHVGQYS